MVVSLHNYGMFKLDEARYKEFIDILDLDDDVFIDALNMYKKYKAAPVFSINLEKIEREGPIPYSHLKTDIGVARMNELLEKNIIEPCNP